MPESDKVEVTAWGRGLRSRRMLATSLGLGAGSFGASGTRQSIGVAQASELTLGTSKSQPEIPSM